MVSESHFQADIKPWDILRTLKLPATQAEETTKRRRGRPNASNASQQSKAAAAPTQPNNQQPEQDANEVGAGPKKRRRTSKEAAVAEEQTSTRTRKTRQSLGDAPPGDAEAPKKQRGRPKGRGVEDQGRNRGRGRVEGSHPEIAVEAPAAAEAEQPQSGQKRRGRPKGRRQPQPEAPSTEKHDDLVPDIGQQPKRRQGRPSVAARSPSPPPPKKRKRGRPSKGGDAEPDANTDEVATAGERDETTPSPESQRRERRRAAVAAAAAQLPRKRYLHVAPRVRAVRQSTIDARWTPLGSGSIAAASEILELAHRPVIQRMSGTVRRRQHASAVLSVAYRRITRKLQRGLPFPPAAMPGPPSGTRAGGGDGGRETELDFERVLDATRGLQKQLGPALHAVELLRREKARMERELERDYVALRNLEAGARTQKREQREKLKRAHVLVPAATGKPHLDDVEMVFDEHDALVSQGNTFNVRPPLLVVWTNPLLPNK